MALRRSHTRFKDYDKTPIGFGVVVFCIAKASCRRAACVRRMTSHTSHLLLCPTHGVMVAQPGQEPYD